MPQSIFMFGTRYTPLEFAHSVCKEKEWVAMTSFTHHPFYQRFALEVPDNRYHSTFLNVPIDTLMARIEQSVRRGHPSAGRATSANRASTGRQDSPNCPTRPKR